MQPYKIDKPIRLIELFAGIGSQAMALRNLGADFTTYRTCEWWIQPNASYKTIHCADDTKDYSADFSKEQIPKGQDMEEEPEQEKIESMDAIKQKIYELTETELKAANEKLPLFASSHEAYAVIFEEFDEAREELEMVEYSLDKFWTEVKENESQEVKNKRLTRIYENAVKLAVEAIQTAAMARKGILSSYQKGDPAHGETTEN